MLKAEKREYLKTGGAKPAVCNLDHRSSCARRARQFQCGQVPDPQGRPQGRATVGGALVHTGELQATAWRGCSAVPVVRTSGGFTGETSGFAGETRALSGAGRLLGVRLFWRRARAAVLSAKPPVLPVKPEPYSVRKGGGCWALCPCPRCQGVQGITAIKPARPALWVQSRTAEAAASFSKGNAMKAKLLRLAAVSAPLLAAGAARAADPATALEAVQTLTTSSAGFGPVMFGLAIASVGIGIGVKWIKRSKGAA